MIRTSEDRDGSRVWTWPRTELDKFTAGHEHGAPASTGPAAYRIASLTVATCSDHREVAPPVPRAGGPGPPGTRPDGEAVKLSPKRSFTTHSNSLILR